MKFALISRLDEKRALDYTISLAKALKNEGDSVIFETKTAEAIGENGVDIRNFDCDIAIIIGGDGSVLHAVRKMKKQIPVIGINHGKVGFLADLEPAEAPAFFRQIRESGFDIEKRMRISVYVDDEYIGDALNEAVIVTSRPAKMLYFSIIVDSVPAERFRADGILISTPTGSTAYAMSAGGPIVDPLIEGFLLVPLAPYHLSSRPHLISYKRDFRVRLESDKPASLVLDGQQISEIHDGTVITIRKSTDPARFINVGKNFFVKVDSKLRRL
ncbi:MAG: NAD(+)/NADH kinase [Methanogenium sp.]|nr:NAD(+)/NADH kinase [Methanogenium sp.]